jgi:hypothetical protein
MFGAPSERSIVAFSLVTILSGGVFLLVWPSVLWRDLDAARGRDRPTVSTLELAMLIGVGAQLLLTASLAFDFWSDIRSTLPFGPAFVPVLLVAVGYLGNLLYCFSTLNAIESRKLSLGGHALFALLCFTPFSVIYLQNRANRYLTKIKGMTPTA